MTVQVSDSVKYKRKKFVLIDVEKGKQLIDCADFKMPEHIPCFNTSCWRGYTAEYVIRKDKLYGTRYEWDDEQRKEIESETLFLNFTGSCVIARTKENNAWMNSDFLECYVYFDEAYELHFTDGILDEVLDLHKAITEAKEVILPMYKSESKLPHIDTSFLKEIAVMNLKYEYDYRTYKWRNGDDDENL